MVGLIFNLIFAACIQSDDVVLGLMLGSPVLPAALLLIALWSCPESPRYYMRVGSRNYSPRKAYNALASIRGDCEVRNESYVSINHERCAELTFASHSCLHLRISTSCIRQLKRNTGGNNSNSNNNPRENHTRRKHPLRQVRRAVSLICSLKPDYEMP